MKKMSAKKLKEVLKKHELWLKNEPGGELANLSFANLSFADLSFADLRSADLDFSSFPLWCGGLNVHLDDRQLIQMAYHLAKNGLFSKNASEETKAELSKIVDFANKFHRTEECGRIET